MWGWGLGWCRKRVKVGVENREESRVLSRHRDGCRDREGVKV